MRALFTLALMLSLSTPSAASGTDSERDYLVWVVSESSDTISLVRFGPAGARVEREIETGLMPVDVDGPHGIGLSRDGEFFYASLGHGRPNGNLLKYRVADGEVVGQVPLGSFPAFLDVSLDGSFAHVANFNLHGNMAPSSVSEEATGKTPALVEVIDLGEFRSAGSVEVGLEAAGLDFSKTEPARAQ